MVTKAKREKLAGVDPHEVICTRAEAAEITGEMIKHYHADAIVPRFDGSESSLASIRKEIREQRAVLEAHHGRLVALEVPWHKRKPVWALVATLVALAVLALTGCVRADPVAPEDICDHRGVVLEATFTGSALVLPDTLVTLDCKER